MRTVYGLAKTGLDPYLITHEYQWLIPHLRANARQNPLEWAIVQNCEGCQQWFPPVEFDDGYHSPECKDDAVGAGWADSMEDR